AQLPSDTNVRSWRACANPQVTVPGSQSGQRWTIGSKSRVKVWPPVLGPRTGPAYWARVLGPRTGPADWAPVPWPLPASSWGWGPGLSFGGCNLPGLLGPPDLRSRIPPASPRPVCPAGAQGRGSVGLALYPDFGFALQELGKGCEPPPQALAVERGVGFGD